MFLKFLVLFYFKNKIPRQIKHLRARLILDSNLSILDVIKDRFRLVYNVIRIRGFLFTGKKAQEGAYYLSGKHNKEVQAQAEYVLGKVLLPLDINNTYVSPLNLKFWKTYFFNVFSSVFCLLDFYKARYNHLYEFFHFILALVANNNINELHLLGVHGASIYALLSSKSVENIYLTVFFNNTTLNDPKKMGEYKMLPLHVRNEVQRHELVILQNKNQLSFTEGLVKKVGNESQIHLDCFERKVKYDIGFFSEGWWMRDAQKNFSIEDWDELKLHVQKKPRFETSLEELLFEKVVNFALENGLSLAVYPHPCEMRAQKNGFVLPFDEYVDNKQCHYGEKKSGISNIFESNIAVTMLPTASLITDRSEYQLPTLFLSESFFYSHSQDSVVKKMEFNRLYYSDYDIYCSNIDQLLKELQKRLIK